MFALPETAEGGVGAGGVTSSCMTHAERCDAVLIGPGHAGRGGRVAALTAALLGGVGEPAFILDAAALVGLRDLERPLRRHGGRVVLTPHAGEMAAPAWDRAPSRSRPTRSARRGRRRPAPGRGGAEGGSTHIVTPQGEAWLFTHGHVGLATSGSGDTLAGVIAGLLARGASPLQAALWGVSLHGEAGTRLARVHGPLGFLARELLAEMPRILAEWGGGA